MACTKVRRYRSWKKLGYTNMLPPIHGGYEDHCSKRDEMTQCRRKDRLSDGDTLYQHAAQHQSAARAANRSLKQYINRKGKRNTMKHILPWLPHPHSAFQPLRHILPANRKTQTNAVTTHTLTSKPWFWQRASAALKPPRKSEGWTFCVIDHQETIRNV